MKILQVAFVLLVVTFTAYTALPAPLIGEAPVGTTRGLGGAVGVTVSWANPNTVLYTCTNPNGFVMLHLIPRTPTGAQPVSYTLSVVPGGGTSLAISSTGVNLVNGVFNSLLTQVVTGTVGQSVVITPLTTTTGSLVVDLLGYDGV